MAEASLKNFVSNFLFGKKLFQDTEPSYPSIVAFFTNELDAISKLQLMCLILIFGGLN
jgi:hypothetical protein